MRALTQEMVIAAAGKSPLVRNVEPLRKGGRFRIETGLFYPDGASIDVHLEPQNNLLDPMRLSDLGNTMAWLHDVGIRPWESKRRERMVRSAIETLGIRKDGGSLLVDVDEIAQLPERILTLAQGCLRVAGIIHSKRVTTQSRFGERVEEYLVNFDLPFDADVDLRGKRGNNVRVDYLVKGRSTRSAVLMLSSADISSAHITANEILRRWIDLQRIPDIEAGGFDAQRVTVVDDEERRYPPDDIERLGEFSAVVPISSPSQLQTMLAA